MWFRISVTISSDAECRTLISEPPPKPSETLSELGFRTKQGLRFTTEGTSIQFELHLSAGFAAVFVGMCVCVCRGIILEARYSDIRALRNKRRYPYRPRPFPPCSCLHGHLPTCLPASPAHPPTYLAYRPNPPPNLPNLPKVVLQS